MIKLILILLVTAMQLMGVEIKAYQRGNIVEVTAMFKHVMLSYKEAKRKTGDGNNTSFITHIAALVDGKVVYDVSTSPYLSNNPLIKFNYDNRGRGDTVEIIAIDSKGEQFQGSTQVRNSLKNTEILSSKIVSFDTIDYRTLKPKAWDATTIDEAIKELYGTGQINTGDFIITRPKYPDPSRIPIRIQSTLELESFAVLVKHSPSVTNAVFSIPPNTVIDYSLNVKNADFFPNDGETDAPIDDDEITVIGKGKDGKLYKAILGKFNINVDYLAYTCQNGNTGDCHYLGQVYANGGDTRMDAICEQNVEKSNKFYALENKILEKECNEGNPSSCDSLGRKSKSEVNRTKYIEMAIQLYEKSCYSKDIDEKLNDNPRSMRSIINACIMLAQSAGNTSNKALDAKIRACDLGDSSTCWNIAQSYKSGENIEKQIQFSQKACDIGNTINACDFVAKLYQRYHGKEGAIKALAIQTKACNSGLTNSCYEVGLAYDKGEFVNHNKNKAKEFYQKSCHNQNIEKCAKLGIPYVSQFSSIDVQIRANEGLEQACKSNDYWACFRLGNSYEDGLGVSKDRNVSKNYYQKACEGHYDTACYRLGGSFRFDKNYEQANKYFEVACENGIHEACSQLGRAYKLGEGVEKNIPKALEFYRKSCKGGGVVACIVEVKSLEKILK